MARDTETQSGLKSWSFTKKTKKTHGTPEQLRMQRSFFKKNLNLKLKH